MRRMLGCGSIENRRRAVATRKTGMVKTTLTWDAECRDSRWKCGRAGVECQMLDKQWRRGEDRQGWAVV